jgi:hypothetical protein
MQAAWPGFAADDASNRLWLNTISSVDTLVGSRAAKSLIDTKPRWPSIADWQSECRTALRAETPAYRELEQPASQRTPVWIQRCRDALPRGSSAPRRNKLVRLPSEKSRPRKSDFGPIDETRDWSGTGG